MTGFAARILEWYARHGRKLPWRGKVGPYKVWISEIMLQQTRVETVKPFYRRWLRAFPNVASLAAASEQDVLRAWEGLGYYARARNLRRAARIVRARHGGRLPADTKALRRLPGIGAYTAGAIASIAFGLDSPTMDANIRRVLARVFAVRQVTDTPAGAAVLWSLAAENLPAGRAGDFNQSLMDLGAQICLPVKPSCPTCPVRGSCRARRLGIQNLLPVLRRSTSVPKRHYVVAVIRKRGRVLLAQRPSRGLLGGMWEFPAVRSNSPGPASSSGPSRLARHFDRAYGLKLRERLPLVTVRHAYSHFRVTVYALECDLLSPVTAGQLRWVREADLGEYPMGHVDRQIANQLVL